MNMYLKQETFKMNVTAGESGNLCHEIAFHEIFPEFENKQAIHCYTARLVNARNKL